MFNTLKDEFQHSIESLEHGEVIPCLLVIGRPKTGKKKLILEMFGEPKNSPEKGEENYSIYRYDNIEVINYDIEEHHNYHEDLEEVLQMINLIWYCSTAPMLIKKEWDFMVIDYLQSFLPTALIITTLRSTIFPASIKKLKAQIDKYYDGPIFPACIMSRCTKKSMYTEDWEGLLSWSISEIEDSMQDYMAVTTVSTDVLVDKREYINNKIVTSYASGAAAIGAVPIPFSDAVLLIPEQVAMTMHILKLYGLESSSRVITKVVRSTVLSQLGRMIAGSLTKLIPGFGSVTGAVINSTVAASLTWALGRSVSEMAYRYKQAVANGANTSFEEYFNAKGLKSLVDEIKTNEAFNKLKGAKA